MNVVCQGRGSRGRGTVVAKGSRVNEGCRGCFEGLLSGPAGVAQTCSRVESSC